MPSFLINPKVSKAKQKLVSKKLVLAVSILDEIGKRYVQVIRKLIKEEIARKRGLLGETQETLPDDKSFLDSFSYRVSGINVEIYSSWPFLDRHLEGRDPYPMKWVKGGSKNNPKIIPMYNEKTKQMEFRKAPFLNEKNWIHPGVAKSNFFEEAKRIMEEIEIPKIIARRLKK